MSARRTASTPSRDPARALRRFDRRRLAETGASLLAGVDEAGRGCLAGPVVAAAVLVDAGTRLPAVADSKRLSAARREALLPQILQSARAVGIGWASPDEIDRHNILRATHLAAHRALERLAPPPGLVLTDYLRLEGLDAPVEPLVKGDGRSAAIAAASIVAKTSRDAWMRELDGEYPGYGFSTHKGYGTAEHLEALRLHGASTAHRHSFKGVLCFETEFRASCSLRGLLAALEAGRLTPEQAEGRWAACLERLPERETKLFREALARYG